MLSSAHLLKLALPLVKTHGFSRTALANSVLHLPTKSHDSPLPEDAVSTLFGRGHEARKSLIDAWLEEGISAMKLSEGRTTRELLKNRLSYNEPVLGHLPEAFALLASPSSGLPPLDPTPAIKNASRIADEACYLSGRDASDMSWYSKRASLAAIYAAAELHQLSSPKTASAFLDSLFESKSSLTQALSEIELYGSYVFKSWKGIIKSSGVF